MKNIFTWQNGLHYLLLTTGIVILTHFLGIHTFHTEMFLPNLNFLKLFVLIAVLDTIIHFGFSIAPGKWKWVD